MCNALTKKELLTSSEELKVKTITTVRCDLDKYHSGPHKGWLLYYSAPGVKKKVRYLWN